MVAQVEHRPLSKNAAAKREALIESMAARVVRKSGYWLVPSSSCQDTQPTKANIKQWYAVSNGYCECRSANHVPNAEERCAEDCIHQEAAARRRDREIHLYHAYEA